MSGIVGTYGDSDHVIRSLIALLNGFFMPGAPNPIPEIEYLNQMSKTGRLPGEYFYPRAIITQMIKRWSTIQEVVRLEPGLAMTYPFQYFEDGQSHIYVFSNTMPLYADIIILQYLYMYRVTRCDFPFGLDQLSTLMMTKYTIFDDVNCSACKIYYDICEIICENQDCFMHNPEMITFGRIFQSYVSVALWMYNNLPEFTKIVRTIFPNSTFPGMIYSWYFFLVLPCKMLRMNCKFLLAVNLAICSAYVTVFPTLSIYRRILEYCTVAYNVYTEEMRIDICMKLGILKIPYGRYILTSNLELHRFYYEIAKETIRKNREGDVTVDKTIENIEQLIL